MDEYTNKTEQKKTLAFMDSIFDKVGIKNRKFNILNKIILGKLDVHLETK